MTWVEAELDAPMVSIVMEVDAVAAEDGPEIGALRMLLDLVLQLFKAEVVNAFAPAQITYTSA